MSKTPWTPAPWRYDGDGEARKIRGKDGASIALLMHLSLRARKSDAEVIANARLIAAAPEMADCIAENIDSAKRIISVLPLGDLADDIRATLNALIDDCEDALAKARGDQ